MYIQLFCLFFLFQNIAPNAVDLSCKDIRAFVDGHNSRRLLLAKGEVAGQPAASKMNSVIWDDELAIKAKSWAAQHNFTQNPDTSIGSGRFTTGENIYRIGFTDENQSLEVETVLDSWFNKGTGDEYNVQPPKYYAQMAWSDSIHIGCGVSQKLNDGVDYNVVCNYGPSGNINDEEPYEAGIASNKLECSGNCDQLYGDKC